MQMEIAILISSLSIHNDYSAIIASLIKLQEEIATRKNVTMVLNEDQETLHSNERSNVFKASGEQGKLAPIRRKGNKGDKYDKICCYNSGGLGYIKVHCCSKWGNLSSQEMGAEVITKQN